MTTAATTTGSPVQTWGTRLVLSVTSQPFARPGDGLAPYIEVFHDWIRREALDETLIDVVSYDHIPGGPGVLLVGHETDYGVSIREGCATLVCRLKRDPHGAGNNLERCLRRTRAAASLLERAGALRETPRFTRGSATLTCNDRLRHPNDDATARRLLPMARATFEHVLGGPCLASIYRARRDVERPTTNRRTPPAGEPETVGGGQAQERLAFWITWEHDAFHAPAAQGTRA